MKKYVISICLPLIVSIHALASFSLCDDSLNGVPLVVQLTGDTDFQRLAEKYGLKEDKKKSVALYFNDFKSIVDLSVIKNNLAKFVSEVFLGESPYHFNFDNSNSSTDAFDSFTYLAELLGKQFAESTNENKKTATRTAYNDLLNNLAYLSNDPFAIAQMKMKLNFSYIKMTEQNIGAQTVTTGDSAIEKNENSVVKELESTSISNGILEMGINLFQQMISNSSSHQVLWSPQNLYSAMGALTLGASGVTHSDLLNFLKLPKDIQKFALANAFKRETERLKKVAEEEGVVFKTATALWANQDFQIQFSRLYLELTQLAFNAEPKSLPFSLSSTVAAINLWANNNTEGMIKEVVTQLSNDEAILTSATFIEGKWSYENNFDPDLTREGIFYSPDGEKRIPLMSKSSQFQYIEDEGYQAVSLPVGKSGKFALTLILPSDGKFESFLKSFNSELYLKIMENLKNSNTQKVDLTIPRFRLDHREENIKELLRQVGLTSPFVGGFDKMTEEERDLFISQIAHFAALEVNEFGFRAAAVTNASMRSLSISRPGIEFRADRPFIAIIQEVETAQPLFMSTVTHPVGMPKPVE